MNLPLIAPIFIWAAAIGLPLLGLGGYALFSKDPKKNKLGILGMQGAGKTRFLSHLRKIPFIEIPTERDVYGPFVYKYNNKVIHIDAGLDIGGGDLYRDEYDRIIKKSDVLFYFFDISKYFNNYSTQEKVGYRRACNSRIEHINSVGKEIKKNIVIVGTHIDVFSKDQAKAKSEFLKLNESKSYYSVLKNIEFIDLTDTDQLDKFIKKVFK